jgi:outer membrane protein assembly factor BamB
VRWIRPLPGTWVAAISGLGTVPAGPAGSGQAYAAAGSSVAAVGFGMTVYAYSARDGHPMWRTRLTGFPAGSQIVSVRVWPGVVTAGVAGARPARGTGTAQRAVVLRAGGGRQLRSFPAAPFGGAITANSAATVVIGPASVTSYDNASGQVRWARAASRAQGWQKAGGYLYLTVAAGGPLGSHPVTGLRRISLRTGAERYIRVRPGRFAGRLGAVLDGVLLFSGGQGVTAYSVSTGTLLWRRTGAVPESVDPVRGLFYLTVGSMLTGVQPWTGRVEARVPGAAGAGAGGG